MLSLLVGRVLGNLLLCGLAVDWRCDAHRVGQLMDLRQNFITPFFKRFERPETPNSGQDLFTTHAIEFKGILRIHKIATFKNIFQVPNNGRVLAIITLIK